MNIKVKETVISSWPILSGVPMALDLTFRLAMMTIICRFSTRLVTHIPSRLIGTIFLCLMGMVWLKLSVKGLLLLFLHMLFLMVQVIYI